MSLSADLISQFVKATKDDKKTKRETTVYGTVVEYAGSNYVKFDGSDLLTPVETTVDAEPGDRVTVLLKDHTATVTGNVSSPAARTAAVQLVVNNVTEMGTVLADFISVDELAVESARIDSLDAENANIKQKLTAYDADITFLEAEVARIDELVVTDADITNLQADVVTIKESLTAHDASIDNLEAEVAKIDELVVNNAVVTELQADVARIDEALVDKLSATDIEGKYANIDFSNISKATMGEFYANSGLIQNVVVGDATITGNLVGVTISGDLIEANTLIADKLVIQGEDGLYYALNTDGVSVEAEQTDYNSLDGSVIRAKSITATKIDVKDLVAFGATIGGFKITADSLYSGVKETVDNTTRGVYLDNDGQVAFGDANRYVKYYQDTDDTYKLDLCADTVKFAATGTDLASGVYGIVSGPSTIEMREDIDALEVRVIDAEASITLLSDSITANVTEITNLGTRATTVEQTASDLTVRLDTAESNISDAAKTATDYLNLSTAGLVVGQNPTNPTAGNTLISTNGVTIRKGTTILSEFKAATRTASGITSATISSSDITDSESDGVTSVSGTVKRNESRANVYISTNGNPVYFPNGIETDKVLINNNGIISNDNILLDGSIVDSSGEGIFTPLNSYGNTIIGYGRYQDGGGTHVYGARVKAKTKSGFSVSVNGVAAIETDNSSGNATFGWHHYNASEGETTIYGNIVGLASKEDIRINSSGNHIRFDGNIVPYTTNTYNLGNPSLAIRDIHISSVNDGTAHGISFSSGSASDNAVGVNASGYRIFGNTSYCTNIVTKSTTTSSTGYSFKITCGDNPTLTVDDNDARLLLFGGTDSTSRYLGSIAVYKRTYSSAANVHVTSSGMIGRSTSSSERYKRDIDIASIDELKGLYDLPVKKFKYRNDYIAEDDELYDKYLYGFIVEDLEDILPCAVQHEIGENGELLPEMWNSNILVPSLFKLVQDLNNRLKILEMGG